MVEKEKPRKLSSREQKLLLHSIGTYMFATDGGLLVQAELILHYQEVVNALFAGLQGKDSSRISPYYLNEVLVRALEAFGHSNLLASPL